MLPERIPLYMSLENRYAPYTLVAMKCSIRLNLSFFGFAFFVPIWYAIFGYPEPENWSRVYEFS